MTAPASQSKTGDAPAQRPALSPIETDDDTTQTPPDPTGDGSNDTLDAGQGDGESRKIPREQRYRLQLRAAEAERDALTARITAYQTREVEHLASELAQPGDLLELGELGLSEYLTEDGDVDPDVVLDAVAALLEQRPGLAKRPKFGAVDPSQARGNSHVKLPAPAPSWDEFLRTD